MFSFLLPSIWVVIWLYPLSFHFCPMSIYVARRWGHVLKWEQEQGREMTTFWNLKVNLDVETSLIRKRDVLGTISVHHKLRCEFCISYIGCIDRISHFSLGIDCTGHPITYRISCTNTLINLYIPLECLIHNVSSNIWFHESSMQFLPLGHSIIMYKFMPCVSSNT